MLAFGFDLLREKRDDFVETFNGVRHESSLLTSGIFSQFFMAFGVGLQAVARTLQPDQSLGSSIFWGCWSSSFVCMALAFLYYYRFTLQTLKNRLRVNCFCVYCCFPSLGFARMVLFVTSIIIFGAGMRCGKSESQTDSRSLNEDNIFNTSYEIEDEDNLFEREDVCQDIVHYGSYAFYIASFLFWHEASKKLRRATRQREEENEESFLAAHGLATMSAARLIPWISFTIGSLYPVWVWAASGFVDMELWELSQIAYEGLIHHYGLLLIAYLAYNCTLTLTYETEYPVESHWKPLALGPMASAASVAAVGAVGAAAVAGGVGEKESRTVWLTEEAFHDLTLGLFEKRKPNIPPSPLVKVEEIPMKRTLPYDTDVDSIISDSSSSASPSEAGSRSEEYSFATKEDKESLLNIKPALSYDEEDSVSTDSSY